MSVKRLDLGRHTIFGDWSDVHGNQVLVSWDTECDTADIFFMDGMDYGGGIGSYTLNVDSYEVEEIYEASVSSYDFRQNLREYYAGYFTLVK